MSCTYKEPLLECSDNVVWNGVKNTHNPPTNPWNRSKTEEMLKEQSTLSFRDLMSEDLAKNLQQREMEPSKLPEPESQLSTEVEVDKSTNTSSDFMLACTLQQIYNEEHDNQIQREENYINKNSKVSISFSKYKVCPDYIQDSYSDEDYQHLDDENRALDSFEEHRRTDPVIPACGYIRHNNEIVTKHDTILSARRNAERVMNFPPSFNTGDVGGFDMQLPNKVYNKLQRTAKNKRKERVRDKVDKATTEKALDVKTRLMIFKLVTNSILESVNKVISMGKESVVFHADGGIYQEEELPSECAIKIFKTTLTDFKTREKYIRSDYRFKDRMSKNNNKMTIQLWAEKEFHNLKRLEKAKIPSPKPLFVKQYMLVMSFIGSDHVAAPKLKYAELSLDQWCDAYEQVISIMTTMFRTCKLVHADMSEYNILWHENKCWVIDLGQAVEPTHPNALKFFYRDCTNIVRFFRSKGLTKISSPIELFKTISEIKLCGDDDDAERLIENYERNRELCQEGKRQKAKGKRDEGDKFEFLWEISNVKQLEGNFDEEEENSSCEQDTTAEEWITVKTKKKNKKKKNPILNAVSTEDEVNLPIQDKNTKPCTTNEDSIAQHPDSWELSSVSTNCVRILPRTCDE